MGRERGGPAGRYAQCAFPLPSKKTHRLKKAGGPGLLSFFSFRNPSSRLQQHRAPPHPSLPSPAVVLLSRSLAFEKMAGTLIVSAKVAGGRRVSGASSKVSVMGWRWTATERVHLPPFPFVREGRRRRSLRSVEWMAQNGCLSISPSDPTPPSPTGLLWLRGPQGHQRGVRQVRCHPRLSRGCVLLVCGE